MKRSDALRLNAWESKCRTNSQLNQKRSRRWKLNEPNYSNIKTAIYSLADDPRPQGCKKLKGRDGYRIRVGDYRFFYNIFDKVLTIEVVALGHRKDIYE